MIKISTRGRYAARIMLFLALHGEERPVRKHEIAKSERISSDYVEQILIRLKSAGLVLSHRGARGGFTLAKPTAEIRVSDILEATEGAIALAPCGETACGMESRCVTRDIWEEAQAALAEVFSRWTLADMSARAVDYTQSQAPSYSI